jgi:hypothetical protein
VRRLLRRELEQLDFQRMVGGAIRSHPAEQRRAMVGQELENFVFVFSERRVATLVRPKEASQCDAHRRMLSLAVALAIGVE